MAVFRESKGDSQKALRKVKKLTLLRFSAYFLSHLIGPNWDVCQFLKKKSMYNRIAHRPGCVRLFRTIPIADISPLSHKLLTLKSLHQTDHRNVHPKIVTNVCLPEPQMPHCQVAIPCHATPLSKDVQVTHITHTHSSALFEGMFPLTQTGEVEEWTVTASTTSHHHLLIGN